MLKNEYLRFSLHPSFLANPSCPETTQNDTNASIRNCFRLLLEDLTIAKSKKDLIKAKNLPSTEDNLSVEFIDADNIEIARGDGYKICPGLADGINISKLKMALLGLGIEDIDMQDYILQLILQNRIGIHFSLIGTLNSLPMGLAKNSTQRLISIPTSQKGEIYQELKVEYDTFFKKVRLIFTGEIIYGCPESISIGEAKAIITISSQFETQIEALYGIIKPYSQIEKATKNSKLLANVWNVTLNLYQSLLGWYISSLNLKAPPNLNSVMLASAPENSFVAKSQPSPSAPSISPLQRLYNWMVASVNNITGKILSKMKKTFVKETIEREPLLTVKQSSTLHIKKSLAKSRSEGSIGFAKVQNEILEGDTSSMWIQDFMLLPSGVVLHKKNIMPKQVPIMQQPAPDLSKNYGFSTLGKYRRSHRPPVKIQSFEVNPTYSVEIKI